MTDEDKEALDIIGTLMDVAVEILPLIDGLAYAIAMHHAFDQWRAMKATGFTAKSNAD